MVECHFNLLVLVLQHEGTRLVRVSNSLMSAICLNETTTHKDKTKTYIKDKHQETFVKKAQHGLVYRKQKAITDYSKEISNSWLKCYGVTSHFEGYIFAIQEQEIYTRALKANREFPTNPTFNKTCRYCHTHTRTFSTYSVLVRNYQPAFTCLSDTTKYANSYTMH